jgi:hypothetical protein
MSTRPQPPIPPEGERLGLGPQSPLSTTDIQTLSTGLDVIRALGRMEYAVEVLERTTNSHGEKIQQIIRQTDRTEFTVGLLDREHVIQAEKLKHLDRVVFVIEVIGIVLAGSGILLALARYLFHLPN